MREVQDPEGLLNNHSKAVAAIINLGMDVYDGHGVRVKNALLVHDSPFPEMLGLRKDHKGRYDPILGPASRSLMNGKVGQNSALANLLARFFRTIWTGLYKTIYDTEVLCTAEFLHCLTLVNK